MPPLDHTTAGIRGEGAAEIAELRRYVIVCAAILALCLTLKLPSLFFPRAEYDEQIYWQLTWNWLNNGTYSLQNMPVLKELPPTIYDRPLFHHPPLLSVLLMPFVAVNTPAAAIVVSWLGHALAVVAVGVACWVLRRRSWSATHFALWLPVLAAALDPVMAFSSRKLWPDSLVGGLGGLGVVLVWLAAGRGPSRWAWAGGGLLGLAALGKLTGLALLPIAAVAALTAPGSSPAERRRAILVSLPLAMVVVLPWLLVFRSTCGVWLPTWIRPDTALIAASPHVAREMTHPWYYYVSESVAVAPVVLVALIAGAWRWRHLLRPPLVFPAAWLALVWLALLAAHWQGHGMQMRYLTPAVVGLYLFIGGLLATAQPKRSLLPLLVLLTAVLGAVHIGFYLVYGQQFDEIVSFPELLYRMARGQP